MIREAGIVVEIVSAGSTVTYEVTGAYPGIIEIQLGSFVFGVGPEGSGYGFKTINDVNNKPSHFSAACPAANDRGIRIQKGRRIERHLC